MGQLLQLHVAACRNNAVSVERRIECIWGRVYSRHDRRRDEKGGNGRVGLAGWSPVLSTAGSNRAGPGRSSRPGRVGSGRVGSACIAESGRVGLVLCRGQTLEYGISIECVRND